MLFLPRVVNFKGPFSKAQSPQQLGASKRTTAAARCCVFWAKNQKLMKKLPRTMFDSVFDSNKQKRHLAVA